MMQITFNRIVILLAGLVLLLNASLLYFQFSWLMLFTVMMAFILFFLLIFYNKTNKTPVNELVEEGVQDDLEAKVQERTLELNIALQELEEVNQVLKTKSTLDELTGLFNRRFYDEKILAEYRRSRRNLTPLSIVVIDIDHFKQVNDSYGHLAGDQCLVAVAAKIKGSLQRSSDISCRYGGEEFCLILPETDSQGAMSLAEEVRKDIELQTIRYENFEIALTISCGVSTYTQQKNIQAEQIFAAADKALYQAKKMGRNQVKLQNISIDNGK
jgi:diguanylate cyclase (GGDEF)-like protein